MQHALKYPAVHLIGEQAWSVGQGFAKTIETTGCVIHSCCVMPDHTHMVVARHGYSIEKLVIQLKGDATERLKADGRHPFGFAPREDGRLPTIWGRGSWNVFLNSPSEIRRKIRYTARNLLKLGFPRQRWHFVTAFEGYDGFED
jgi:REP element-mobilizing transposase RayT